MCLFYFRVPVCYRGNGDDIHESYGKELGGLLGQYAQEFSQLSYSRANEYEADAVSPKCVILLSRLSFLSFHAHVFYLKSAFWAAVSASINPSASISFFKKLDGGNKATSWESTHPGSKDRIKMLEDKYSTYLSNPSRGPEFIPAGLVPLTGGGGVGGVIWNVLSSIPQHIQLAAIFEVLKVSAEYIDYFISNLEETSSNVYDNVQVCQDGKSAMSLERVRSGYFIHLGFGDCLTDRDLRDMSRSSMGVTINPYTQEPFTQRQKSDINKLLRGERLS